MGQAFRRAVGKQRTTNVDPSSSRIQNSFDRTPPAVPDIKPQIHNNDSSPGDRNAPVMEERDSRYEAMLSQMVGRIHTKPGGKLEMGERLDLMNHLEFWVTIEEIGNLTTSDYVLCGCRLLLFRKQAGPCRKSETPQLIPDVTRIDPSLQER
ncbi:uncharacterized protein LOC130817516 isoform X2 [Amaranthus tricolor]|uniref:uncharacterized protein LOC130817516 isoform X2 n=1 Tax=Amaranthus tricolor TaxID=29722 RepID=UPI00258B1DB3|nr:uncharacterized protein LOC130817516 isoform X2 [Amaranthus tricolor]